MNNKPLKRFGQNYLVDEKTILRILSTIRPEENETILEIGPGHGALTKGLADSSSRIIAVEIDSRVIDELKKDFPTVYFIHADILTVDLPALARESKPPFRVVGNIPYNLTASILFKLIGARSDIKDAILMMQHEVAMRLSARLGTKDYGILAVLLQTFFRVEYCFKIAPGVFYPKPNVDSAIVKLTVKPGVKLPVEDTFFISVVKAAFGQRRKTLRNALRGSIFHDVDFADCPIDLQLRAERLTTDNFSTLSDFLFKRKMNHD